MFVSPLSRDPRSFSQSVGPGSDFTGWVLRVLVGGEVGVSASLPKER